MRALKIKRLIPLLFKRSRPPAPSGDYALLLDRDGRVVIDRDGKTVMVRKE